MTASNDLASGPAGDRAAFVARRSNPASGDRTGRAAAGLPMGRILPIGIGAAIAIGGGTAKPRSVNPRAGCRRAIPVGAFFETPIAPG
jgi:hypothetical protein